HLGIFALLTRRPPPPPPFRYTTLFRSQLEPSLGVFAERRRAGDHEVELGPDLRLHLREQDLLGRRQAQPILPGASPLGERTMGRDRKSTRLNSSHVKSSYAVFCLKKKR